MGAVPEALSTQDWVIIQYKASDQIEQ